jgi:hypothetical protein
MLSTCPSCLTQILHEDGAEQINCDCGENFSPFLAVPPVMEMELNSPLMAVAGKSEAVRPSLEESIAPENASDSPLSANYAESEAAFAELRSFGESLDPLSPNIPMAPEPQTRIEEPAQPGSANLQIVTSASSVQDNSSSMGQPCAMTAGDSLSGYEIDSFLSPISVLSTLSGDPEDPLKQAHATLAQRAQTLGANGVVSVRWAFTPDGSRILLTGTPVKCRKKG